MMDNYGGYEVELMHLMEDELYDELEKVRDEWDCIDMVCTHFDGDICTLGGCYDPNPLNLDWKEE